MLRVQTQATKRKAVAPEQLIGAHLYLDIARSGYLFHGYSAGIMLYARSHIFIALVNHNVSPNGPGGILFRTFQIEFC